MYVQQRSFDIFGSLMQLKRLIRRYWHRFKPLFYTAEAECLIKDLIPESKVVIT